MQWTPHWFALCNETVPLDVEPRTEMVWHFRSPEEGKISRTQSFSSQGDERTWWSWRSRWEAGGQRKQGDSSVHWRSRARSEIPLTRKRAEQAWRMRWRGMLACTVARAVASLLGLTHSHGGDGNVPAAHEVDGDHRYAGLAPG